MKFVTYEHDAIQSLGLWLDGDRILDVARAAWLSGEDIDASSMLNLIRGGDAALEAARRIEARAVELGGAIRDAAELTLLAPIPRPARNIFCVGRNYVEHIKEGDAVHGVVTAQDLPLFATFFSKPPTTIVGPNATVRYPINVTNALDYEVELAVIIGKGGRDIAEEDALDHVFGYSIINDVSARDLQRRNNDRQWFKGKSLDTTCPMGPWIVDKAEIGDVRSLELTLKVNGQQRQNATVDMMIFDIPSIIAQLSEGMTLEVGDVIATGTPSGVGFAMTPPTLLKGGDVMECHVSRIGSLVNTVIEV